MFVSMVFLLLLFVYLTYLFLAAFFYQSRNGIACKTFSIVNGAQAAASSATVFFVLRLRKSVHAGLFDGCQVFLHAHSVIVSVSYIHTVNLFAGILIACKTKAGGRVAFSVAVDPGAFSEQVGARPVSRAAAGALAPLEIIDMREIPAANRAVHAARRNKFFWDWMDLLHFQSNARRSRGAC